MTSPRALFAVAPLLGLLVAACATTVTYAPTDENARMSLSKARRLMAKHHIKIVDNRTLVTDPHYMFRGHSAVVLPLKGMRVVSGKNGTGYGSSVLEFSGSGAARFSLRYTFNTEDELAEAIFVAKRQAEREGFAPVDEDAAFRKAVGPYLAGGTKPELPLEALRFKAQAEDAVREKRFDDGADLYGEALGAAPWWAAGHYNRALVLGETERYSDAVAEMGRYLVLASDADNADAARKQIFKWEAKAGE
jgi:hypothetical protein